MVRVAQAEGLTRFIPQTSSVTTRIIACSVFRSALEFLQLENRLPDLKTTYLETGLHLQPHKLRSVLTYEITAAQKRDENVICLYAECFQGASDFFDSAEVIKIPGTCCHEILLGPERFGRIICQNPKAYFIESEVVAGFENHCIKPLRLENEKFRRYCFGNYQKLVYVQQPADINVVGKAQIIAAFLNLELDIHHADYSYLEEFLDSMIQMHT